MKKIATIVLLMISVSAVAQTTDSSTYFYQKGIEEKTAKRWLVASKNFERAIAINDKFIDAYLENGYVNLEMRRTDPALASFTKVIKLDSTNTSAIKELVDLYYNYHQYQKAIDYANKCTSCGNFDKIIAQCYFQLEDYAKAEKILLKLVAEYPLDAQLIYTLGRTYLEMELEPKAIPYYIRALQIDSTKSNWHFELGLMYFENTNYKNAVISFNKALENGFTPSNDFNENLGFAYIYSGEFDKGEKILLDVASRKRGDKDLLRDIAQVYYHFKMYDKSLEFCQKLMEMEPNDGEALYQAGLCFQKKGDVEKGQKMCDKAISIDPSLRNLKRRLDSPMGL